MFSQQLPMHWSISSRRSRSGGGGGSITWSLLSPEQIGLLQLTASTAFRGLQ